jgi:hypothetical protein
MTHDPTLRPNPVDPDDPNRLSDPYLRRPARSSTSGIALVFFGIVAVLLIGFAMLGNYSDTSVSNTTPPASTTTTEPATPPATPPAAEPTQPSTGTGTSTSP